MSSVCIITRRLGSRTFAQAMTVFRDNGRSVDRVPCRRIPIRLLVIAVALWGWQGLLVVVCRLRGTSERGNSSLLASRSALRGYGRG